MNEISIYIKNLYDNFNYHLKSNKRVLFSGPFGIGKTYFLKEYFKDNSDKYNVFHLFPVNYQVAQNEDIFELIKIDILYHILGQGWTFGEEYQEKISKTLAAQAYTVNKASSAFQALLKIFSLGKSKTIVDGLNELESVVDGFTKYYEELNTNKGTLERIKEYRELFENKKGSIYELDSMTQLICELLEKNSRKDEDETEDIDASRDKRENVLIIDDLDRIDPEHIFRILNVFSAHFDMEDEDSNKFGFDKVIFVCDINNIRNIFSAKYGIDTDFNGYINKFFSSQIYYFDNKKEIKKTVSSFVDIQLNQRGICKRYISIKEDIIEILELLIDSDKISIRQLKNLESFNFTVSFFNYYRDQYTTMLLYWHLINLLLKVFNNDLYKLKDAFSNLKLDKEEMRFFTRRKDRYLKGLILLVDIEKVNEHFQGQYGAEFLYKSKELDIKIKYSLINTGDYFWTDIQDIISYDSEEFKENIGIGERNYTREISLNDICKLFIVGINELDRKGMLIRS